MALDFASVPSNFSNLLNASRIPPKTKAFSVIGVCVESLDPIKCVGGQEDWKSTFTLHDPVWLTGAGMDFSFFTKEVDQLPVIKDQGDVVVLRNVRTIYRKGLTMGISTSASSWVVLPYTELGKIETVQDLKVQARWQKDGRVDGKQYPAGAQAALPNEAELKYAKWIAEQEDPSQWPPVRTRTRVDVSNVMVANGGTAPTTRDKFKLLQHLEIPPGAYYFFADLLGEVRRVYCNDFLTELYVTDYSTNDHLYDYKHHEIQGGCEGDPYGYIKDEKGVWPGPWGKMTITVRCNDGQSHLANTKVKPGDFVLLRNIQITMDKNGMKLEGNCRDDPKYPAKEMIEVVKTKDERRTEVIRRKKAYEAKVEADGIKFFRDPKDVPKKRPRVEEAADDQVDQPKSKRSKAKNRDKKKTARQEAIRAANAQQERTLTANPSIRIHNYPSISNKTIVDILDPDTLKRKTPKGNLYLLPFQSCTYKSNIRVVDFFPNNIADFAAPHRISEYEELSDHESSSDDSDVDLAQNNGEVRWEWRFVLLVEDAKPLPGCQDRPSQMELLVADLDGDGLLNMDACNLRDKKNESELAALKEKLFFLWGDLQEKKEECDGTKEVLPIKASARPFECLIKEYGVPVQNTKGQTKDGVVYQRLFRLFGTSI